MEYFPKNQNLSLEYVRVSGEKKFYERFIELSKELLSGIPFIRRRTFEAARLRLMSECLWVTEKSAPGLHSLMQKALNNLNHSDLPYDIFQITGDENAWTEPFESHPLITLQGRMMTMLDDASLTAVIGHELGHCFCHSESSAFEGMGMARQILLNDLEIGADDKGQALKRAASVFCQCCELTADRVGLLATRDVEACLRLEMICMTGLSSDALTWDCEAFMAQSEVIVDEMRKNGVPVSTHPCAGFRAWAIAKFAQTDVYRALTGQGPGTLKLEDLDREIIELFDAHSPSEEDLDSEEIPAELMNFALCACFLMAWVDGEFSDREADFLEKTFSGIIPDYQKYFDIRVTCQTLDELTPYIRQSCMHRKLDLFFMLYLLIESDGVIDEREVRLLLLIGRLLGCYELWAACFDALCQKTKCIGLDEAARRRVYSEVQGSGVNALGNGSGGAIGQLGCDGDEDAADGDDSDTITAYFEDICAEPSGEMEDCDEEDSPRVISSIPKICAIRDRVKRPTKQRSQKEETENAIALFCSNVQRRGSSRTTLARLLRLAGMKSSERVEAVALYRSVFPKYGIVAEPSLDEMAQMALQDVIVLTSTQSSRADDNIEIQIDSPVAALIRAFARLQASQVSGNGRSLSVRCRCEKTGRSFDMTRLNRIAHGRTERVMESLDAEKDVVIVSPTEAGKSQAGIDISRCLEALSREMKSRIEEQGASHLYVGSSFISGCVNGYEVCAPLMLRPVELSRMDGGVSGWTLAVSKGNGAKVNHAVLRMIAGKKGSAFTEDMVEKLDEAALCGDEALTACVDELGFFMGVRGGNRIEKCPENSEDSDVFDDSEAFEDDSPSVSNPVEEEDASVSDALYPMSRRTPLPDYPTDDWLCLESCAMLGFFPQSSSETLKEYGEILKELQTMSRPMADIIGALNHVLPHNMLEGLKLCAAGEDSADDAPARTVEIELSDKAELPLVSLDPSQLAALCAARTEEALVIDGPPGTGKSQVIVGIVLDALARGLKVAVVSDKRAALDVVAQRLSANGFEDIYGIVYDVNKDRTELFGRIAARLAMADSLEASSFEQAEFDLLHDQYESMHREMNERQRALLISDEDYSAADYAAYLASLRSQIEIALADNHAELMRKYAQTDDALPLFSTHFLNTDPELAADIAAVAPHNLQSMRETLVRFIPYRDMYAKDSWWSSHHDEAFLAHLPEFASFVDGFRPYCERIQNCLNPCAEYAVEREDSSLDVVAETWFKLWRNPDISSQSPESLGTPWGELDACVADLRSTCTDLSRILLGEDDFSEKKFNAFRAFADEWKSNRRELQQVLSDMDGSYSDVTSPSEILDNWRQIWVFFQNNEALETANVVLPWRQMFDMSAEMLASHASFLRVFKPSYWKLQKNMNLWFERNLPSAKPEKLTQDSVSRIRDLSSQYLKAQKQFALNLGSASLGFEELANEFESFDQKKKSFESWFKTHQSSYEMTLVSTEALDNASALARRNIEFQNQLMPCMKVENLGLDILHDELCKKSTQAHELNLLRGECSALFSCVPQVAEQFFEITEDEDVELTDLWQAGCCQLWAEGRLKTLCDNHQGIISLCSDEPSESGDHFIDRFKRLESELIKRSREKLHEDLLRCGILSVPRPQPRARRTPEQKALEAIQEEATKKTRHKTLRTFVHTHADTGLLDILPVWLLSPETMTVLFPRKPVFDLVIFDEASQATVASSLPALLRAKRWIIAGDDKQMPPSSFFTASTEIEETDRQNVPSAADVFDSESLLTLARSRAKHTRLSWHYRSQHDALIAFSNYAFYDGDLKTVPEIPELNDEELVLPDSPKRLLRWVAVQNASYDKGRNPAEARRVAELLYEALKLHPEESVGIITFNINQRYEIMDAIDGLCRENTEFAELYHDAQQLPIDRQPFIKSIENVQGDERDAIFFSLGHCAVARKNQPQSEAHVPARFGPLGLKGGERRLNVAISRAKIRSTVVASFEPHQLAVGNVRNSGPAYFKLFVEFMWASAHDDLVTRNIKLTEAQRLMQTDNMDAAGTQKKSVQLPGALSLAALIAHDAEQAGFDVELNVGIGPFKLPLALYKEGHQPVAVLIQNEGTQNAYDAIIHRPSMLAARGWRVVQTNAVEWLGMRDKVMAQF